MRYLLLPLFTIRLLAAVLPSLLTLLAFKLLPYRSIIASSIIFSLITIVLLTSFSSSPSPKIPLPSEVKLIEQKNQLESWLKKQPTHRDILLNLSKINQSLENEQQALEFLTQAQSLDPNNDIFQEN